MKSAVDHVPGGRLQYSMCEIQSLGVSPGGLARDGRQYVRGQVGRLPYVYDVGLTKAGTRKIIVDSSILWKEEKVYPTSSIYTVARLG